MGVSFIWVNNLDQVAIDTEWHLEYDENRKTSTKKVWSHLHKLKQQNAFGMVNKNYKKNMHIQKYHSFDRFGWFCGCSNGLNDVNDFLFFIPIRVERPRREKRSEEKGALHIYVISVLISFVSVHARCFLIIFSVSFLMFVLFVPKSYCIRCVWACELVWVHTFMNEKLGVHSYVDDLVLAVAR